MRVALDRCSCGAPRDASCAPPTACSSRRSSTSPRSRELVPYLRDLGDLAPLPLAVAAGARRARRTATTSSTRPACRDALGGEDGPARARAEPGSAIVLDIVPNHMGTGDENRWWADEELRARFFDFDPRRPAGTGASSTSTTSPACASRTRRSSSVTHGKVARARARRASSTGCASTIPTGSPTRPATSRLRDARRASTSGSRRSSHPGEPLRDWPVEGTVGYEFLNDAHGAVRRPGRRGARSPTLYAELTGDDAAVRRGRARGAARAGDDDVRARGRAAARRSHDVPGHRRRARRAAGLPHLRRAVERPGRATPTARRVAAAGIDERARATRCCSSEPRPRRVRHALPADLAAGDGQGRRGHRLLPLHPAARAQRGRRRPGRASGIARRRVPRGATPSAPSASRAACSSPRPTTRSARATSARGSARWPGWPASGATRVRRWRELSAPLRADGAPDANEEYLIYQTLVGAWPIARRAPRGLPREGAARGQAQHELGRAGRRLRGGGCRRFARALLDHEPFLADFEPFARAGRARPGAQRARPAAAQAHRRPACPTSTRATSSRPSRSSTPTTAGRSTGPRAARRSTRCAAAPTPTRRDVEAAPHRGARSTCARAGRRRSRAAPTSRSTPAPGVCAFTCAAATVLVVVPVRDRARRRPRCAAPRGRWRDVLTGARARARRRGRAWPTLVAADGLALLERA